MHSKEIGWYHVDGFLIIFPNYIANFQQRSQYSLIVLLHSKPKQTNVIQHYWTRKSKTTPENIFGSQGASPIHNMNIDAFFLRPRAPFRAL